MKKPYKFTHRKGRNIEVCFASQPNRWLSCGTANQAEALEFALKHYSKTIEGKLSILQVLEEIKKNNFEELKQYFKNHSKEKREVYYTNLKSLIDKYLLPLFKYYTLESLTTAEIEKNLQTLDANNLTKNRILEALRIIYKFANLKGYTDRKLEDLESFKYCPNEKGVFIQEELNKLLRIENFTSPLWFLYFLILRDTGWRPSEVASLRFCDIKDTGGVATSSSVVYNGKGASLQDTIKTTAKGQKYKIGILSKDTLKLFEKLDKKTEDLIFVFDGSLLLTQKANRELEKACKRANVKLDKRTQYSFRHTFNTNNYYKLDDKTRLELMGHTKERKEYLHLTIEERLKNLLTDEKTIKVLQNN